MCVCVWVWVQEIEYNALSEYQKFCDKNEHANTIQHTTATSMDFISFANAKNCHAAY